MFSELTFLATCDLVGLVRGRAIPGSLKEGTSVGWVPADLAITSFGGIWDENPFGSQGDLRLIPVPGASFSLPAVGDGLPWTINLAKQSNIDGTPWQNDPREFAERALVRLKSEFNIDLIASFEHEFLLRGDGVSGSPFGLDAARVVEPFGSALVETLAANQMEPENWLPEYGSGQFEITLAPCDALIAADRAIALREIVRDLARRNNLKATFVPLPHPDSVGNGVHVHLSLWRDGEPLTYDATKPGNLSSVASKAFNGILNHAAAILAWTAPSAISFLRLTPHRWSAGGAFIAVQDREALLRIAPITSSDPAKAASMFNVEFRAADATANPWLVIGVLAHALVEGLRADREIAVIGVQDKALPASLEEAIAGLKADVIASEWFPKELQEVHLGIRETEAKILRDLNDAERCERYTNVY